MSNTNEKANSYITEEHEEITSVEFSLNSNPNIVRDSVIEDPAGLVIAEINNNGEPVEGGTVSRIFGVAEMGTKCRTCGENSAKCPGHFGHIHLTEPVFHVGFITYLKTILSCICIRCNKLLIHKNEEEIVRLTKNKIGKQRFDEIRNAVKGVTHCHSCGTPAHKIKKETPSSNIYLIAEPVKRSGDDDGNGKKRNLRILTPQLCYDILKLVSDEDYRILGFDPTVSRPEDMIIVEFPVPPIQVRPSIKMEMLSASSADDDLTHKLVDIIKNNENLKRSKGDGSLVKTNTISEDFMLLQFHVATFFNNSSIGMPRSQQKNKKQTKSLSERLGGKEGRVRGNLMGKRVDQSGRTVITPDPNIALNEVGIPLIIAKNLTFPEIVSKQNINEMNKLVTNGTKVYPGANFVIKNIIDRFGNHTKQVYQLKNRTFPIKLEYGDIVERHLVNGDMVLFNRQPSLHKLSMMGHLVNVLPIPNLLTFRVNVSVTDPYNADFDGDEMNIHVPQSIQTVTELRLIANAGKRLIKQSHSDVSMNIKQDSIMGSFQLSHNDKVVTVDWKDAMNTCMATSVGLNAEIPKFKKISGKMLYSQIIPKTINIERNKDNGENILKIVRGIIQNGTIGKSEVQNIIHKIWFTVGDKETVFFIDDLQKMLLQWLMRSGFTSSIKDCVIKDTAYEQIYAIIETKRKEVLGMITEYENDPYIMTKYAFETFLSATLSAVSGDIQSIIGGNLNLNDGIHITVQSKSAGDISTLTQIIGACGQVIVEGQRMRKDFNNRTLPMYYQHDNSAYARGFTHGSFTSGLNPSEMFFSAAAGREGMISTAIKSVTGDTPVIILEDNVAKQVLIGDWIDSHLAKSADKVEHYKDRDMELLQMSDKAYIPTADMHGNTSWGEISAITRHDPGKELYQIKTHGGRKVIVTESKSLLIWNSNDKMFERMSTPDVKIGDFVPVTMKLSKPDIINEYVDVSKYIPESNPIKLTRVFGREIGRYLGTGTSSDFEEFNSLITKMVDKKIPDEAFTAPDEFVTGLIQGFFADQELLDYNVSSKTVIDGIAILLSRFGIFAKIRETKEGFRLAIKKQWRAKFVDMFTHDKPADSIKCNNFIEQNDVVLDKIIEINKIDVALYPKVYDLTIPSTLNFGLANGLHVVDTADTGYLERKLIKILEDIRVKYDGTVRNANDKVLQYVYGDNGLNTEMQIDQKIGLIAANNKAIREKYIYTNEEITKMKKDGITTDKYTINNNDMVYEKLVSMRNKIRNIQRVRNPSAITFTESYMMPVDLNQFIMNLMNSETRTGGQVVDPYYVLTGIKKMYSTNISKLMKYNDATSTIKKQDEQKNKYLLKFYIFDVLSPKRCTHEYKLNKEEFDSIVDFFQKRFKLALVPGGEMVGIVAAQSIGEPVTQSNLKSFHKAGTGKTVTAELPRIKELLSVTPNLKTPTMKIILDKEYENDLAVANTIASHLRSVYIKNIIDHVDIIYDPKPDPKKGLMLADGVNNVYEVASSKNGCQKDIQGLPMVIRLVLSKEKMNELSVSLLEIKSSFCKNWLMRNEDSKGSKKEYKKVVDKIQQCAIVSNFDNSPVPIIHVRFDSSSYSFNTLVQFQDLVVNKYLIKGIQNITDSSDVIEESYIAFDEEGTVQRKKRYVINTIGVNLMDIAQINGIDLAKTTCNDIVAIYDTFGVNAAKAAFIKEFTAAVFSSGNTVVNYHHIKILADAITHMGTLNAVNRHGANKLDTDPFSRASFEKTVEQMLAAAAFSQKDYMRSVSAQIIAGAVVDGGTGAFELLFDHEKVKRSTTMQRKAVVTKTIKKSSVVADLIKKKQKN